MIDLANEQQLQQVIKKIKALNHQNNPDNKIIAQTTVGWSKKANLLFLENK